MGTSANRSGLSVVDPKKPARAGTRRNGPPPERGVPLEVVKTAERLPALQAPSFLKQEVEGLAGLVRGMRECDAANDLEFSLFVRRAATPEATGLEQRDVAARLFLAPMTLQRWARGDHLPYPLPRRGYLDGLAMLVERRIEALQLHGVHATLATPRRGARRSATPPGKA